MDPSLEAKIYSQVQQRITSGLVGVHTHLCNALLLTFKSLNVCCWLLGSPNYTSYQLNLLYRVTLKGLQGNPQRMRLQRRLYGIYTVCFLIFMIPCNCKLVFFFAKSSFKSLDYYIQGRILNLSLESTNIKSVCSSLQSHPLWITLYDNVFHHTS